MLSWYSCQNIPSGGRKEDSRSRMLVWFRWTVEMFISVAPVYQQFFGACVRFSIKTIVITIIYYIYAYTYIHYYTFYTYNSYYYHDPGYELYVFLEAMEGHFARTVNLTWEPVNHFVTILSGSGWYAHLSPQGWFALTATNCVIC